MKITQVTRATHQVERNKRDVRAVSVLQCQELLSKGEIHQHATKRPDGAGQIDQGARAANGPMISFDKINTGTNLKLCLRVEDRRDHLVRRPVTDAAQDEQNHKADEEQRQRVEL